MSQQKPITAFKEAYSKVNEEQAATADWGHINFYIDMEHPEGWDMSSEMASTCAAMQNVYEECCEVISEKEAAEFPERIGLFDAFSDNVQNHMNEHGSTISPEALLDHFVTALNERHIPYLLAQRLFDVREAIPETTQEKFLPNSETFRTFMGLPKGDNIAVKLYINYDFVLSRTVELCDPDAILRTLYKGVSASTMPHYVVQ